MICDLDRFPLYFPSISSIKTKIHFSQYIEILNAFSTINSNYLISAFDLMRNSQDQKQNIKQKLSEAQSKGIKILMDSGNYESFWQKPSIVWEKDEFYAALNDFPCNYTFGFDEQTPPDDANRHIDLLLRQNETDKKNSPYPVIPIVHGKSDKLIEISYAFVKESKTEMLAIPERCLGEGIFERAKNAWLIRKKLNELEKYIPVHLLGTGNPFSIALYTLNGMDSFDGLEWCQTSVDSQNGILYHFSQNDFLQTNQKWNSLPYSLRTIANNLEFYDNWMNELRNAKEKNTLKNFIKEKFTQVFSKETTAILL